MTLLELFLAITNVHSPSLTFSSESTWFFFIVPKVGRILKSQSSYSTNLNQESVRCTLRIVLQNPRHPLALREQLVTFIWGKRGGAKQGNIINSVS